MYALWMLEPHESKSADLKIYKATNRALTNAFSAFAHFLKPDTVHDAARVLRLPGSINSKAPEEPVAYVIQADRTGKGYTYTLEELAMRMGTLKGPAPTPVKAPTPVVLQFVIPGPAPKVIPPRLSRKRRKNGLLGQKMMGMRRLHDIEKILTRQPLVHGFRYKGLLIIAHTARAAGLKLSDATALLDAYAKKCAPAYPCEANDTCTSILAAHAYSLPLTQKSSGPGLAKFFGLSRDDCEKMMLSTIYTEDMAEEKATARKRRIIRGNSIAAALKEAAKSAMSLDDYAKELSTKGIYLSNSQISRKLRSLRIPVKRGRPANP